MTIELLGNNYLLGNYSAILESHAYGVGAAAEAAEIHGGAYAEVGVGEYLLANFVEDGYLADSVGALDVHHAYGWVRIEADVGALGSLNAYIGSNGEPSGSSAVGSGAGSGEGYINIIGDVADLD